MLFQELLDSFIPLQEKESLDKSLDDQDRKSATAAMEQRYQCLDWMHKQNSRALTWNSKDLHWLCASAGVQVWCPADCRLCPFARVGLSDCPSGRGESGWGDEAIWGCLVLKLEASISVSQSLTMKGRWSLWECLIWNWRQVSLFLKALIMKGTDNGVFWMLTWMIEAELIVNWRNLWLNLCIDCSWGRDWTLSYSSRCACCDNSFKVWIHSHSSECAFLWQEFQHRWKFWDLELLKFDLQ